MSVAEQPALPFYENSDFSDVRFPLMSFREAADRTYPVHSQPLDELEATIRADGNDENFAAYMRAFKIYCAQASLELIDDDSEKYHGARHSLALRVVGLCYDTRHYSDARSEVMDLRRELAADPNDPLVGYVASVQGALRDVRVVRSNPVYDASQPPQPRLFDD